MEVLCAIARFSRCISVRLIAGSYRLACRTWPFNTSLHSGMQQASLKHFNLPHPLELRRIRFPAIEALELPQLVSHPGTKHPHYKGLNIPVLRTSCRSTTEQRKERHALDNTPPHRGKIQPNARALRVTAYQTSLLLRILKHDRLVPLALSTQIHIHFLLQRPSVFLRNPNRPIRRSRLRRKHIAVHIHRLA
jgi:hypothetical protein